MQFAVGDNMDDSGFHSMESGDILKFTVNEEGSNVETVNAESGNVEKGTGIICIHILAILNISSTFYTYLLPIK